MNLQLILTGLIIATAAGFAVYRAVIPFTRPASKCHGCTMESTGCALKELKEQVKKHPGS